MIHLIVIETVTSDHWYLIGELVLRTNMCAGDGLALEATQTFIVQPHCGCLSATGWRKSGL